ncbi:MAG: hypothetical protein EON54_00265 [Alcaligenaceae bacterium]|nr:MAG: hypothetical protein EON54_00265 [Alcaligenaceae bacterium]
MSVIHTLVSMAARCLRSDPPAHPEPIVASTAQPQRRPPATEPLESLNVIYESILRCSQLASATSLALADLIDIIHRDESVQRAAGTCAAKHQRLIELAGFRSEIHAAIHVAIAQDGCGDIGSITPDRIAEVLRQHARDIDAAIDDQRDAHAKHEDASRKRMTRYEPLRSAVRDRLALLISERDRLIREDESAGRASSMGLPSRYAVLRNAGMSEAQIGATEPTAISPEVLTRQRQERIAEINPQVSALKAFGASPNFDTALLDGLGFDELIVARDAAKVAA